VVADSQSSKYQGRVIQPPDISTISHRRIACG
jgi:hypothetical protein